MAQEIRIQANGKKRRGKGNLSFLFNGSRKMAKSKKGRKKGKRPGKNPFAGHRRGTRGRRGGRNPFREGRSGMGGDVETILGAVAASVVPDLVETNLLPQFNSGFMGYIADAVLGGIVLWGGGKFVGKNFAKGALAGVAVKVSIRALQDIGSSPHNAIAANVRDAQAAAASTSNGNGTTTPAAPQMGTTVAWPFRQPQIYSALPGAPTLGAHRVPQRQIMRRR
jgi:hypothetical protein